ncbi:MAG: hypothetical protein WD794_06095 [Mycobacteriales bacterium]
MPAPDLMTSIAALISSGEAWNVTSVPQDNSPLQSWSRSAPAPAAPPATSAPARSSLEEALAGLLPQAETELSTGPPAEASAPVAAQPASRVQLGFRDGTSTMLDPSSSQSMALEQLAQSLTSHD